MNYLIDHPFVLTFVVTVIFLYFLIKNLYVQDEKEIEEHILVQSYINVELEELLLSKNIHKDNSSLSLTDVEKILRDDYKINIFISSKNKNRYFYQIKFWGNNSCIDITDSLEFESFESCLEASIKHAINCI